MFDYRIAREPREWWAVVGEPFAGEVGRLFVDEPTAQTVLRYYTHGSVKIIKVREVLGEVLD